MPRVKKSVASRARRNKWLGMAKGFRSGRRRLYRSAREAVERALTFAYRDRKVRKREFRSPVDRPHQRRAAAAGNVLQQIYRGPEKGRDQPGPQGPGRPGGL